MRICPDEHNLFCPDEHYEHDNEHYEHHEPMSTMSTTRLNQSRSDPEVFEPGLVWLGSRLTRTWADSHPAHTLNSD